MLQQIGWIEYFVDSDVYLHLFQQKSQKKDPYPEFSFVHQLPYNLQQQCDCRHFTVYINMHSLGR